MELFQDAGSIPVVFINFNPDQFGAEESCFKFTKKGLPVIRNKIKWQERLDTLKTTIQYHIDNIPEKEITTINLYYDDD